MEIRGLSTEQINLYNKKISNYITSNFKLVETKYIDLGVKTVRILNYSKEFTPHIEKQLTYVLKDNAPKYDATLVLWKEENVYDFYKIISPDIDPRFNIKARLDLIYNKKHNLREGIPISVYDDEWSKFKPIISTSIWHNNIVNAYDKTTNTYYYGVNNLEPEEFIKEGHIFVQIFNNILKTETSNLVHGAVIGLNGNGICFCARGQRGKSTLSVLSMMKGFEYVSDDYLILHQNDKKQLLSSPIYSIITLSPEMYNRLYDYMQGSSFVSNNARKDKYVFNISNFHDRFKKNYPIKLCIFPEIVTDKEPSIRQCTLEEKGRAIVQIIQSTLMQTQDLSENQTVKKIMNMLKDLPFYKFNLCHDIDKNTEFLRDFMNKFEKTEKKIIETPKIAVDITFDLANILNTETGIIYSMNSFATNLYENILNGVSLECISAELAKLTQYNKNILAQFDIFLRELKEKGILMLKGNNNSNTANINIDMAMNDNFNISFIEYSQKEQKELINIKKTLILN